MSEQAEAAGSAQQGLSVSIAGPGTAGPQEAAAIVAAVERFVAETAPPPTDAAPSRSGWERAALLEGVSAKQRAFPPDPSAGFPVGF